MWSPARVRGLLSVTLGPVDAVELGWPLAALLVLLAVTAAAVVRVAELGSWRTPLTATARAVVQLSAVSLVIVFVLRSMGWTLAFVALMVLVAAFTACRRVSGAWGTPVVWVCAAVLAGVVPAVGLALATTVVPFEPIAVLPIAGILVGGAMTATALAGKRTAEELETQRGAYEAALGLGLNRRQAVGVVAHGPPPPWRSYPARTRPAPSAS